MKSTFSVIYYLKRQVVKKDGTVPVMGRITVDGSQTQFSCKLPPDTVYYLKVYSNKANNHYELDETGASTSTIRKSWSVTTSSRRRR